MKKYRWLAVLLLLAMVFVPYCTVKLFGPDQPPQSTEEPNELMQMQIKLYRTASGKVETVNCYDYICGVVAGEMQANSHPEALKAQAVAAFTYTVNKMEYVLQHPESDIGHRGAYVCDDYSHCKAYLEKQDAMKKWGKSWYNKYYPNIESAVTATLGKIITYDGAPINAVFHAISNGKTCSAYEVWGTDVPYLTTVECAFDKTAADYESVSCYSLSQFSQVFADELGVTLPEDPSAWIGGISYAPSGMVDQITIGNTVYAGTHIRKLFSLRSATFRVELQGDQVRFTVYGYGHGVGMSQNGANEMAKNGSTFEQILTYFYKGTAIQDYKT